MEWVKLDKPALMQMKMETAENISSLRKMR